jgi:peptide/nickel transport system substrate-binding protein
VNGNIVRLYISSSIRNYFEEFDMTRVALRLVAAAVFTFCINGSPPALAKTPSDTLVVAWSLDDMITLDPAESFEFSTGEVLGNSYQNLVGYDLKNVDEVFGVIAQSWSVSPDGKTFSFTIRPDLKFASGNSITAADAVYSLTRTVKLDKSPAFILTQFGLTPHNVDQKIRQTSELTFDLEMDKPYSPKFLLYCLTATVGAVVDKKLVSSHQQDGDFGYNWLKTHYAGSGPFKIRDWRANEVVVLDRNIHYTGPKPALARILYRHMPEPSTQRLLLEKADIDIARNLTAEHITALGKNAEVTFTEGRKGAIYYLGLNQKNPHLAKPQVRQAMKYLIDYATIADTIMKGKVNVHQAFLPQGIFGALSDTPFSLNVAKAKVLLAEAGLPDGFKVTMDTSNTPEVMSMAQAIQQTMALAGITLQILPSDGKQALTKYRARRHDIFFGRWGTDYQDPHSNADAFASNPDNADQATVKPLAWRNSWSIPEMSKIVGEAVLERDSDRRKQIYLELQTAQQQDSPFVIMFQEIEVLGTRSNVKGVVIGPSFNSNSFRSVTK